MDNKTRKSFSDMQGLTVAIPSEGRSAGTVEDLYFKPGTNAIYALRVRTRLLGYRSLPVTGIISIGSDTVAIPSAEMLSAELPPLPLVGSLRGVNIVNEKGATVGTIREIQLAIDSPRMLRIIAFEAADPSSGRARIIDGASVDHYAQDTVIIHR